MTLELRRHKSSISEQIKKNKHGEIPSFDGIYSALEKSVDFPVFNKRHKARQYRAELQKAYLQMHPGFEECPECKIQINKKNWAKHLRKVHSYSAKEIKNYDDLLVQKARQRVEKARLQSRGFDDGASVPSGNITWATKK